MTPEEYIKTYTRGCSNVVDYSGISPDGIRYHEWLTPENALAAVELAREEIYKKLFRMSLSSNAMDYVRGVGELMDELKKDKVEKAMDYLNEKIALTTKNGSWDGVDVDEFIDKVRGRE